MLSQGLQMGLLIGSVLLLAGSVGAWYRQRMAWAVGLLMAAALLLRLLLAAVPLASALRWLRTAAGRLGGLAVAVLALAADARPWTIVGYHFAEDIGISEQCAWLTPNSTAPSTRRYRRATSFSTPTVATSCRLNSTQPILCTVGGLPKPT